jgi:thioredoxin reductase (NADPH)
MSTTAVENWPGEKSIMGPKLMMNMKDHAQLLGCSFASEEIVRVDFSKKPFTLFTKEEKILQAHCVIIASGATPKRLGCPGEQEYWARGVSTCAVCDGAFYKDKKVIIVGGGDTAMEDSSFMTRFTDSITLVHILDTLTASATMQQRVINNPKIKIIYNSTVSAIKGNGTTVTQAVITNQNTKQDTIIDTDAVFIAIGLNPNTAIFKGILALNDYGYLLVKDHTKTSISGIFAAGDVADYRYRQAITSAGAGCMAALDAERYLKETLG